MARAALLPAVPGVARTASPRARPKTTPRCQRRRQDPVRQAAQRRSGERTDPDAFVLWHPSGQQRLPNTLWRPHGSGPPLHPDGPHGWCSTLRSALDGAHARPRTSPATSSLSSARPGSGDSGLPRAALKGAVDDLGCEAGLSEERLGSPTTLGSLSADRCQIFEGDWASRADGELRGRIEQGHLMWEEDGTATPLWVHGERGDVLSMMVDGQCHYGVLSEDGRLLRWADGDVWLRVVPESAVDHSMRDQSYESFELDECLPWAGWSARSRPGSFVRPTSKSAASAAFTAYSSGAFLSWMDGPMPPKPSAVFM
mmetsp:Transcript_117588/g.293180  ORF Transcript_117588/g.293180 Transcript_117588/m.293180 type:complete len:313 (-) Transcript_117588:260-1198(-)